MKSVSQTNSNAPFSGLKLELSKYRLNQTKADTTTKKPQTVAKPVQFQSRKNNQTDTKALQPRLSARSPNISGRKPSFSVFFPREDEMTLSMPNLSEVLLTTEQDVCDNDVVEKKKEKSAVKKKMVEIVHGKNLAKYTKKKTHALPKTQVWSFLDLSDKEDGENTSIMGSDANIDSRKSIYTMRNSYMTTLPDDEYIREEINRRCNTEVLDKKSEVRQSDEQVLKLKTRVKELEEKNAKWDLFGRLISKCYQATRKERQDYKMQNELDKKTIASLKEQICALKTLSKAEKATTAKAVKKATQESEENRVSLMALGSLTEQLKALTSENWKLKRQISSLKEENKEIKDNQPDVNRYKAEIDHYKAVAGEKLKECSSLAEEIICLRTDLDRINMKYLKAQKELNGSITPPSAKKTTLDESELLSGEKRPVQKKNRTKSMDRHSMEKLLTSPSVEISKEKHVSFWEPTMEDIDTPSPRTFKMAPLGQETNILLKE